MSYYEKKYIIYEILKECKDREFSFLGKNNVHIRALKVRCIFDFERALKLVNWEKNKPNLYRSVATLKNIPIFTFNPKKRSKETGSWFKDEYSKHVTKYDIFLDFDKEDGDSWNDLIKEIKIFKEYLDEYEVPYVLLFSGNKGFQIIISGDYLDIKKIEKGNIFPHKTIVENIKKMLDLKFLDLAGNGVNSKLCKIPYSLVGENIALPLSNTQLKNFNVEDMKMENILKNVKPLVRRGNLERFSNLDLKQKRRNVETFIKVFDFK